MTTIPSLTFFFDSFVLIGFVSLLLWYYSTCTFGFWKRQKIAFKQPVPFFGNLGKFALQIQPIHECLREIYAHFRDEPYGGFFQMRDPTLLIRDPDLVHAVLIRDFKNFIDRGVDLMYPDKELNPLKIHLFGLEGDQWRALRRKLSPIFTSTKLKRMQDQVTGCIDKLNVLLEKELEQGVGDMDLKMVFERLTMNVIGSCAFGIECNTFEQNSEFMVQGKKVFQPNWLTSVRALVTVFNKKLLKWLRLPDLPTETTKFFLSLVLDTMKYRRRNKIERPDSLQLMMGLQNAYDHPENAPDDCKGFNSIDDNDRFDEVHIAANSFLFFTAGFETTASTLSYCLYELALNQTIQKRLREELENEYNENDHCWSVDSLKGNSYLDAVISETLRKYPPLPWVFRRTNIDWTIPGTKKVVPKYTKVIIPVWSIHHDWRNFPNPECFDPERFRGEMAGTVRNGSFIPFGDGPRNCIGARFAKMEIRLALADMIRKYDITPCSQTRIPLRYVRGSPLLSSADGIWMNIAKRKT